jgi:hypothetical protein
MARDLPIELAVIQSIWHTNIIMSPTRTAPVHLPNGP